MVGEYEGQHIHHFPPADPAVSRATMRGYERFQIPIAEPAASTGPRYAETRMTRRSFGGQGSNAKNRKRRLHIVDDRMPDRDKTTTGTANQGENYSHHRCWISEPVRIPTPASISIFLTLSQSPNSRSRLLRNLLAGSCLVRLRASW